MKLFKFSEWLEGYKDIDADLEDRKVQDINMTASLPFNKEFVGFNPNLTRGFHLNTIIGRMMQRWVAGLRHAPVNWHLIKSNPSEAYKWRVSETDKRGNNRYKAAYDLFKQEIANAVAALPFKRGLNLATGKQEDILIKAREFLVGYKTEERDLLDSLSRAWDIYVSVWGEDSGQARNFKNFLEIVRDEFMRTSEILPSMGEDEGLDRMSRELIREIEREIDKYDSIG